jgi:hypothetical protein
MIDQDQSRYNEVARVRRALSRGALASLLAVAMLGIGVLPAGASGPTMKDSKFGFSFSMPNGWRQIPLTKSDISGLGDLLAKDDPSMKILIENQIKNAGQEGIKDLAFGPISTLFASNINVVVEPAAGPSSGSAYFDAEGLEAKLGLSSVGMSHIHTSTVTLPIGKELQATYTLPRKDGPKGASGLQLYVRRKSHLFIVTITSSTSSRDRSTALVVEKSWRWVDSKS